jgi:iron(III) transport system ATP-binding protein
MLRMIAGFITPTGGRIRFGDRDVTTVSPSKRDIGMVFQNYALFPHMSVADNVAYGLKVRRVNKAERSERITTALSAVGLTGYGDRRIDELSGGQQQRVALARAMVGRPDVLLFDEPLSNLDAELRRTLRNELARLHEELRFTAVYVTHDQTEAFGLATTVTLMERGRVVQSGRPQDLYLSPATRYVAEFFGANCFARTAAPGDDGAVRVRSPVGELRHPEFRAGMNVAIAVDPRAVHLGYEGSPATVDLARFLGPYDEYVLSADGATLRAVGPANGGWATHDETRISVDAADIRVFDEDQQLALDPARLSVTPNQPGVDVVQGASRPQGALTGE